MRKYAISFFICAIIGAFISIFSIWILMLHTFVFGLLGLSIGYLMYGIIDYRIKFWEDFLPVLFAAIVMAAVMMFIIGAIFHTPNLYAYIYCLTIIFIMDLLGEHRDKLNNEEYFTSALIFGTISICIYIAFVHNKISLVYCGISGLTGIFITGFVTSSLFRWVILALGWSAGIVIPISISYYLIKEFPEISTGTKLGIIILIVIIASG